MIAAAFAFLAAHIALALPVLIGGGGLGAVAFKVGLPTLRRFFGDRHWLLLLAVAIAAAALYAWGARAAADRDRAYAWRERVCAGVGINTRAPGFKRGMCSARILDLAKLERDTLSASNAAMGSALAAGRQKASNDLEMARATARDTRAAAEAMEKTNAAVSGDRVGGDWFDALNRAGGLRAP